MDCVDYPTQHHSQRDCQYEYFSMRADHAQSAISRIAICTYRDASLIRWPRRCQRPALTREGVVHFNANPIFDRPRSVAGSNSVPNRSSLGQRIAGLLVPTNRRSKRLRSTHEWWRCACDTRRPLGPTWRTDFNQSERNDAVAVDLNFQHLVEFALVK